MVFSGACIRAPLRRSGRGAYRKIQYGAIAPLTFKRTGDPAASMTSPASDRQVVGPAGPTYENLKSEVLPDVDMKISGCDGGAKPAKLKSRM
jgi:hypothetical protein